MSVSAANKTISQQALRVASAKLSSANQSEHLGSAKNNLPQGGSEPAQIHSGKQLNWLGEQAAGSFHSNQGKFSQHQDISAEFKQQFFELANSRDEFNQLMEHVFGGDIDIAQTDAFRTAALNNDFSWLPNIEYVSAENMNGGMAAYSSTTNTIYINEDIKGTALAQQFYSEEVGHFLDNAINESDTSGDEGELFQLRLAGEQLSTSDVDALSVENDHGTIIVNGEQQDVEFGFFKRLGRAISRPIKKHIIDPIKENIIEPIKEKIIDPINKVIIQPVLDIVKGGVDAVVDTASYLVSGVKDVLDGHVSDGLKKIFNSPIKAIQNGVGAIYDGFVVVVERVFHVIDKLFNLGDQRGLSADEITHLELVYGDSIDYSEITIHRGGTWDSLTNPTDGVTIRNDIYIPNKDDSDRPYYDTAGNLNALGLQLLVHEVAHVWQYNNDGLDYINSSSTAQINNKWFGSKDPYRWEDAVAAGVTFENMGVEQQAHLIEDIGVALHNGTFVAGNFEVNNLPLTDPSPEWTIILNARDAILS